MKKFLKINCPILATSGGDLLHLIVLKQKLEDPLNLHQSFDTKNVEKKCNLKNLHIKSAFAFP
jgi:hypothetical protein